MHDCGAPSHILCPSSKAVLSKGVESDHDPYSTPSSKMLAYELPPSDYPNLALLHPTQEEKVETWKLNGTSWRGTMYVSSESIELLTTNS